MPSLNIAFVSIREITRYANAHAILDFAFVVEN